MFAARKFTTHFVFLLLVQPFERLILHSVRRFPAYLVVCVRQNLSLTPYFNQWLSPLLPHPLPTPALPLKVSLDWSISPTL